MTAVLAEERGRVLVITINRPDARNAVDAEVAQGIAAALDTLDGSDSLAVAVITGAGGSFCAGMDLKAFAAGSIPVVPGRGFAGIVEAPPRKPIIAAVEGFALAGGFEIVLACDLVVASSEAVFGLPEVTRGLTAAAGGLFRLPQRVPRNLALELALTGRRMPAAEAHEVRLVNLLVEPNTALDAALGLAETIAANAPLAVAASKRAIVESLDWPSDAAFERQAPIVDPVRSSRDANEGARAFVEKRAPAWTGT